MDIWHDSRFVVDSDDPTGRRGRWTGWFSHDAVDTRRLGERIIRAKVEGEWREYSVVELPEEYLDWNFSRRLEQLGQYREMLAGNMRRTPTLSGPHSGMVASHGASRRDAQFTLNNAVKGIGWLPRPAKLVEVRELFLKTRDDAMPAKLAVLGSLYRDGREIFDRTKQTSLELYARPGAETQTFLNQLVDAGVTIVFLDLPLSYKLRCIVEMLHPDNPDLTDYQRRTVDHINLVHDYFHGRTPYQSIGVVYHVVEVFDNSPRGAGRLIAPPIEE